MANLAFSKTIYTEVFPRTHSNMNQKPFNYDEMSALATIMGDEFEAVTLTGTDKLGGYTKSEITLICFKDNHNYGFFLVPVGTSTNCYLRAFFYYRDEFGNEKVDTTNICDLCSSTSNGGVYNLNVITLTINNNLKLFEFRNTYGNSYYNTNKLFVTTAKDYNGSTKKCFVGLNGSNGNIVYSYDGGISKVTPSVGSVSEDYLTYIGLQQVIDSVHGIVFDHIFFTTHRADSCSHFIEVEGVKFYAPPANNSNAQFYIRDIVE